MEGIVLRTGLSLIFLIVPYACPLFAQNISARETDAVATAGIASLSLVTDANAVNPAATALSKDIVASTCYTLPWGLTSLSEGSIRLSVPTKHVNVSVEAAMCGDALCHFTTVGGGVSRQFGRYFSLGLQYFAVFHTLPFADRASSSYSRFGFCIMPASDWTFSVAIRNVERNSMTYETRSVLLEPVLWLSCRWVARRYFTVAFELEKDYDQPVIGKGAVCIRPTESLHASFGFSSLGQAISAGAGYDWSMVGVQAAVLYDMRLGVTSSAAICLHISRDRQ